MSKYEADTKYIFVNTENLEQRDGGDQVNRFKLNLGANPVNSDDDSLVRISLTQFNMAKNFYNVNDTNNSLRIFQAEISQGSLVINAFDTIIKIPPGDYITQEVLLLNLCRAIKTVYEANRADTASTVEVTITFTSSNETTGEASSTNYRVDTSGTLLTPNSHIHEKNTGLYQISIKLTHSGLTFDTTTAALPIIECLHIPPNSQPITLSSGQKLTANEQYNDSYILLGIPRQTTYVNSPTNSGTSGETGNHFTIIPDSLVAESFAVFNQFPAGQGLNTMPYIYVRANLNTSLATTNLENLAHNHQGNVAQSHILGKIPRKSSNDGIVHSKDVIHFKQDDIQSQTMVITQNMINEMSFSITDSKGRVIPVVAGQTFRQFGQTGGFPTFSKVANKEGNLFCDFTLKVERLSIPFAPNVLQGAPNIKRVSVNPISSSIPLKNNGCGF